MLVAVRIRGRDLQALNETTPEQQQIYRDLIAFGDIV